MHALLVDMQTLVSLPEVLFSFCASSYNVRPPVFQFPTCHGNAVVQAAHAEFTIGTPLFMVLNVLHKKGHGVNTELETLMYVLIFTFSGGILPWRHMQRDNRNLTAVKCGIMASSVEFSLRVLKYIPKECCDVVEWLRQLFFTPHYRTDVTCAEFIANLHVTVIPSIHGLHRHYLAYSISQ